jgi:hypothetical protein
MFTNIEVHECTDAEVDFLHMFLDNIRIIPSQEETAVDCKQTRESKVFFLWPQNSK